MPFIDVLAVCIQHAGGCNLLCEALMPARQRYFAAGCSHTLVQTRRQAESVVQDTLPAPSCQAAGWSSQVAANAPAWVVPQAPPPCYHFIIMYHPIPHEQYTNMRSDEACIHLPKLAHSLKAALQLEKPALQHPSGVLAEAGEHISLVAVPIVL